MHIYIQNADGSWPVYATQIIQGPPESNYFGIEIALYGSTLAISGRDVVNGTSEAGGVYLFTRDENIWTQKGTQRVSPTPGTGFWYGHAMDLGADTLIIGEPRNNLVANGQGTFYVHSISSPTTPTNNPTPNPITSSPTSLPTSNPTNHPTPNPVTSSPTGLPTKVRMSQHHSIFVRVDPTLTIVFCTTLRIQQEKTPRHQLFQWDP